MQRSDNLIIATHNQGKLKEFRNGLKELPFDIISLDFFPELSVPPAETGKTFTDNALLKAKAAYHVVQQPVLADDSGLEVDALDGAPGIYSARFAGENATDTDNISHLLEQLKGVPEEKRTARFVCILALVGLTPEPIIMSGSCEGRIISAPRGEGGFGYDPVFLVDALHQTFAEITPQKKAELSHRGEAIRKIIKKSLIYENILNR